MVGEHLIVGLTAVTLVVDDALGVVNDVTALVRGVVGELLGVLVGETGLVDHLGATELTAETLVDDLALAAVVAAEGAAELLLATESAELLGTAELLNATELLGAEILITANGREALGLGSNETTELLGAERLLGTELLHVDLLGDGGAVHPLRRLGNGAGHGDDANGCVGNQDNGGDELGAEHRLGNGNVTGGLLLEVADVNGAGALDHHGLVNPLVNVDVLDDLSDDVAGNSDAADNLAGRAGDGNLDGLDLLTGRADDLNAADNLAGGTHDLNALDDLTGGTLNGNAANNLAGGALNLNLAGHNALGSLNLDAANNLTAGGLNLNALDLLGALDADAANNLSGGALNGAVDDGTGNEDRADLLLGGHAKADVLVASNNAASIANNALLAANGELLTANKLLLTAEALAV